MSKFLTEELFNQLKDLKTDKGWTLHNCIQTGVMTPHLHVGAMAGDEQTYVTFAPLFDKIIEAWHGHKATDVHVSDLNPDSVTMNEEQTENLSKYVVSTRIRAARNLRGFSLPPGTNNEDREGVYNSLTNSFSKLDGELKGTFYDLGKLTSEQSDQLRSEGFLFQKPSNTNLLFNAGAVRDWPNHRGIFHNDDKTILCWCNEEDHCRIISMSKDGDVKSVFRRFCELSHGIKDACGGGDAFMYNDHLGFIGACPSNLGTGLRASVMVRLLLLNEHIEALEKICTKYDLQPRGSAGEHSKAEGGK